MRGLSLLEGIVSLFVIGLALFVAAGLLVDYGKVFRHVSSRDRIALAAAVGLERMRSDVEQAWRVTGVGPELRLEKLDPAALRYPTGAVTWNPRSDRVAVRYHILNGSLMRDSSLVCEGVSLLNVSRVGAGLSIELTVEGTRLRARCRPIPWQEP